MTRTKMIVRQITLDKASNVKSKLARAAKNQSTRENRSTRGTRLLLEDTKRKLRRFKQESK
jgi:hypothetical protein